MLHEDFYKHNIYTRGFLSRLKCWLLYVIFLLLRFFCKYSQQGLFYGHAMSYTKCQSNDKENNNYFLFVGSISSFHHHLFFLIVSFLSSSLQTNTNTLFEYILGNNDDASIRGFCSFKGTLICWLHSFIILVVIRKELYCRMKKNWFSPKSNIYFILILPHIHKLYEIFF